MQKKPITRWIVLLVLPFFALFVVAIAQVMVKFTLSKASTSISTCESSQITPASVDPGADLYNADCQENSASGARLAVNLISLIVGTLAVISIFAAPLWIIMLIKALDYNRKLIQGAQPVPGAGAPMPPIPNNSSQDPPQPPIA